MVQSFICKMLQKPSVSLKVKDQVLPKLHSLTLCFFMFCFSFHTDLLDVPFRFSLAKSSKDLNVSSSLTQILLLQHILMSSYLTALSPLGLNSIAHFKQRLFLTTVFQPNTFDLHMTCSVLPLFS